MISFYFEKVASFNMHTHNEMRRGILAKQSGLHPESVPLAKLTFGIFRAKSRKNNRKTRRKQT